jgi:hypothetical protein
MPRTPHADVHPDVRVINFHVEETVRGYGRNGIPETAFVPLAVEVLGGPEKPITIIGGGYGDKLRLTECQILQLLGAEAYRDIRAKLREAA